MRLFANRDDALLALDGYPNAKWTIVRTYSGTVVAHLDKESRYSDVLSRVEFHVVNLRNINGTLIRDGRRTYAGRIDLSHKDWILVIDKKPSYSNTYDELREAGGYAITHFGELRSTDRRSFSSSDAIAQMQRAAELLSFAQGAWATVTLATGYSAENNPVWKHHLLGHISEWKWQPYWLPQDHESESLRNAHLGFQNYLKTSESQHFGSSLYWYINANQMTQADGALILAQTALEQLAHLNSSELGVGEQNSASTRIRNLLAYCSIPNHIPEQLAELTALQNVRKEDLDGPRAITLVRNQLVHPKNKLPLPLMCYWQAKCLALHYVELVLLRLFGYQGRYVDRTQLGGFPVTRLVPWGSSN